MPRVSAENRGRLLFGADQILSAGTNFVVGVGVSVAAPLAYVGEFALAYLAFVAILAVNRAAIGQIIILRPSERQVLAPVIGSLILGLTGSIAELVLFVVRGDTLYAFFALAFPFLILQDTARYITLGTEHHARAALADGTWLVASVGAIASTTWWNITPDQLVASWLLLGAISLTLLTPTLITVYRGTHQDGVHTWVNTRSHIFWPFLADALLTVSSGQTGSVVLAVVAGVPDLGSFRIAQTAIAPLSSIIGLWTVVGLRIVAGNTEKASSAATRISALRTVWYSLLLMGLLATAAIVFLSLFGQRVFGPNWDSAQNLFFILCAGQLFLTASATIGLFLRRLELGRLVLRIRLLTLLTEPILMSTGAVAASGLGAAIGQSCGQATNSTVTAIMFWRRQSKEKKMVQS